MTNLRRDGDLWKRDRETMLLEHLQGRGIRDPAVLQAMAVVPREAFVPRDEKAAAYEDRALPLTHGQTISQPYTVAFMCESLQLKPNDHVLEVGTGSGYGAAVLAQLSQRVDTIERVPELAQLARRTLSAQGISNVTVHVGDGTLGLPEAAPFDAIVVTAGGDRLPPVYPQQLAVGGRIVIPLQDGAHGQRMHRFVWDGKQLHDEDLGRFSFVPLVGVYGWSEHD